MGIGVGGRNGRKAVFVETDTSRIESVRQRVQRLPSLAVRLAQVLQSGSSQQRPFRYMPNAFNARDDVLLREKKWTIIDQMRRHPVIADAMRAKRAVLIQGWQVPSVDEKDPVACAVAKFLSDCLDDMRGGFISSLYRVTNSFDYGYSLHERQLKIITRGPWLGMYGLDQWKYRLPHWLDFEVDRASGRLKVLQRKPGSAVPSWTWADQCIYYVYKDDLDPYTGEGDLRSIYNDWWLCDTTEKLAQIDLESQATGRIKVGIDLENDFKELTDEMLDEATKVIDNWQNLFAFIEYPGLKVEALEGRAGAGTYFMELISKCEERMRQGIGKPDLLAPKDGSDPGSYSRAKAQKSQHYAELGKPQNDLEELVPEQVFVPLLQVNGIPEDYCPPFLLSPPEPDQGAEQAKQFDAGLSSGAIKHRGDGDEDQYRQWIGARPIEELGAPVGEAPSLAAAPGSLGPGAQKLASMIYGARRAALGRKTFVIPRTGLRQFGQADDYQDDPGLWVRIKLPPATAELIAIPGGEPAEDLHLTLAFIGRQSELPPVDPAAVEAALAAVSNLPPLRARISGAGQFLPSGSSDGLSVVHAMVDAPGLSILRLRVVRALAALGLPPKPGHDFDPHVTLARVEPGEAADLPDLQPAEFLIDHVTAGVFGTDVDIPLAGQDVLLYRSGSGQWSERRRFEFGSSGDQVSSQIDRLATDRTKDLQYQFAKALWDMWGRIEKLFLSDKATPKDKLEALQTLGDLLNLEGISRGLFGAAQEALEIGQQAAQRDVGGVRTFAASSVNPAGGDIDLTQWLGLAKARSYRVSDELKAQVVGRIRKIMEKAYESGETGRATQARLEADLSDMAGAKLIEPGPSPGQTFKSPLVQESMVRTAMADAADRGKVAVWIQNPAMVLGFERYEDIDPDRNHPLSPKVNGLRIRFDHPLANEFIGSLHYNERGGVKPVSARKAEQPGFAWSSDAEIRKAYEAKVRLSPDFV